MMKRRIIGVLLSMALVLTSVDLNVFASEQAADAETVTEQEAQTESLANISSEEESVTEDESKKLQDETAEINEEGTEEKSETMEESSVVNSETVETETEDKSSTEENESSNEVPETENDTEESSVGMESSDENEKTEVVSDETESDTEEKEAGEKQVDDAQISGREEIKIELLPELEMEIGQEENILLSVFPEDLDLGDIIWEIENVHIAAVGDDGLVTAIDIGETDIIAKLRGTNAESRCHIVIKDPNLEISRFALYSSASYDGYGAAAWAKAHNDEDIRQGKAANDCIYKKGAYDWLCAEYVSNAISRSDGGKLSSVGVHKGCTAFRTFLLNRGYCTEHIVKTRNGCVYRQDLPSSVSVGDIVFFKCSKAPTKVHNQFVHVVMIAGWTSDGKMLAYSHNNRNNGEKQYSYKNCGYCKAAVCEAHILHFNENTASGETAPVNNLPIGNLDIAEGGEGTLIVKGWAIDPDDYSKDISIHVYIGGRPGQGGSYYGSVANNELRPDVKQDYPSAKEKCGFNFAFKVNERGTLPVYVFAIDANDPSQVKELGSANVTIAKVPCSITFDRSEVTVNKGDSIPLDMKFQGDNAYQLMETSGDLSIVSVTWEKAEDGNARIYINGLKAGSTILTIYILDKDKNKLYSKSIAVKVTASGETAPVNNLPIGNLDIAEGGEGTLIVKGWAIDPDDYSKDISIHVYIGGWPGQGGSYYGSVANNELRPDVKQDYPSAKEKCGFNFAFKVNERGTQPVYVFAIDANDPGQVKELGSANVTIAKVPCSITFDRSEVTVNKGDSIPLEMKFQGDNAYQLMETSGDLSIVSATWEKAEDGNARIYINGLKAGSTILTIYILDKDKNKLYSKSIAVKVNVPLQNIILNKNTSKLSVDLTDVLSVNYVPEDTTESRNVTWTSSNTAVATVNGGTVTAKAAGTAVITANVAGRTASCTVTVSPGIKVTDILLDKSYVILYCNGSEELRTWALRAEVTPSNAQNKNIKWTSNNESIATVSQQGEITARAYGTATIMATALDGSGVSASCVVSVNDKNKNRKLSFNCEEIVTGIGTKKEAEIDFYYEDSITNVEIADSSVASYEVGKTILVDGVLAHRSIYVTGLKAGKTTLTVTSNSDNVSTKVTIPITVKDKVTGVAFEEDCIILSKGVSGQLRYKVLPENAYNKKVIWETLDNSITCINGIVTGSEMGVAKVRVKTEEGNFTDTMDIVVVDDSKLAFMMSAIPDFVEVKEGETVKIENLPYKEYRSSFDWDDAIPADTTIVASKIGHQMKQSEYDCYLELTGKKAGVTKVTINYTRSGQILYSRDISVKVTPGYGDILEEDISPDWDKVPDRIWIGSQKSAFYTGKEIKPDVRVYDGNKMLLKDKDYTLSYKDNINVGTAVIIAKGKGNYNFEVKAYFTIEGRNIENASVRLENAQFEYTGEQVTPQVHVIYAGTELELNDDYTVEYLNNIEVGTAKAVIRGSGYYFGEVTMEYEILPKVVRTIITVPDRISISVGEQYQIPISVTNENIEDLDVFWYTDDTDIIKVDSSSGLVTAIAEGEAAVHAESETAYAICIVKVHKAGENGKDEPGEVLPDDIPEGGIPDGLWIAGVSDAGYAYTGKAIKPSVRVYDHDTRLTENRDYTISYKNNVNASDAANEGKAPSVIVKAKGNYTGKETATFKILAKDINSAGFDAIDIAAAPKGKVQKPVPVLTFNGKKLSQKKDFTIEYPDKCAGAYKENGTYSVKITGKGNYTGERTVNFTITSVNLISEAKVSKISNQHYTGSTLTPAVKVKYGKIVLTEGVDYELEYRNNTEIGTASVVIKGIGGYCGQKSVPFKITGAAISKAQVTGLGAPSLYTGAEILKSCNLTVFANGNQIELKQGQDYTAAYQNNVNAGNATIIFSGINGYSGMLKKTFKIDAYNMAVDADNKIRSTQNIVVPYNKNGCSPNPEIYFGETKLVNGKDYSLSYRNNKKVNNGSNPNKIPVIIVKGKGNFKGTITIPFTITTQNLENLTLTANDKVYKKRANIFTTAIKITDVNGKALNADKDYDKNSMTYTYVNDVVLENGVCKRAGDNVEKTDIIPADTRIQVTADAKDGSCYAGTAKGTYRIVRSDIKNARISIPAQVYTGKSIVPAKSDITVSVGDIKLKESEFEIVSCTNNIKKGKAFITIKGMGNYGGTKELKFTIKSKGFSWWWRK